MGGEVPGEHHNENPSRIRKERSVYALSGDKPRQHWAETSGTLAPHSLARGDFYLWALAQKPGNSTPLAP